ncbi:transglycosylase SLT domain-containing protein [Sulfitobacter sp. LCG007]
MASAAGYRLLSAFYAALALSGMVIAGTLPVAAAPYAADVCDQAAISAGRAAGVPVSVLRAITRTETGRARDGRLEPWSWTVNMEGTGVWFDSEQAAKDYVAQHLRRGARSFDVGCFQLNYKWHGHAFASIDDMFDPVQNARYAARFLAELYRESGDWSKAAGTYHSRTPEFANRYIRRFDRIVADLSGQQPAQQFASLGVEAKPIVRENNFPLLQTGGGAPRLGSLVPLGSGRGSLFARAPEGS